MKAVLNFFKDMFMISPDSSYVGLSGFKQIKKVQKKSIAKSVKKSEQRLSDLMRKKANKIEV